MKQEDLYFYKVNKPIKYEAIIGDDYLVKPEYPITIYKGDIKIMLLMNTITDPELFAKQLCDKLNISDHEEWYSIQNK